MAKRIIAKNQTGGDLTLNDMGALIIPASSQLDLGVRFSFYDVTRSADLETEITSDNILINDGIQDLTKAESLSYLNFRTELIPYNPEEWEYMLQANVIYNTFLNHTEVFYLESSLKNVFVDLFKGTDGISSSSQVEVDGAALLLGSDVTPVQKEDFEDVSDWVTDNQITFAISTDQVQEGTYSGKMNSNAGSSQWRGVSKVLSSENWSSYDTILVWVHSPSGPAKIRFYIEDDVGGLQYTGTSSTPTGWGDKSKSISGLTRGAVSKVGIEIQKNDSASQDFYLDDLRLRNTSTYYSSGYSISTTQTTVADVTYIYFSELTSMPEGTSRTIKVSLDGGTTYHTMVEDDQDFHQWVDVSTWAEYGSFVNLKNIVVRIDLATTDTSKTPTYDDYFIMWKLNV